jgi:hypothetical protein
MALHTIYDKVSWITDGLLDTLDKIVVESKIIIFGGCSDKGVSFLLKECL